MCFNENLSPKNKIIKNLNIKILNAVDRYDFIRCHFWAFIHLIHSTNIYQGACDQVLFQVVEIRGQSVIFFLCAETQKYKYMLLNLKIHASVNLLKQKINGNNNRPETILIPVGASKIMHLIRATRYRAQNPSSLKCRKCRR